MCLNDQEDNLLEFIFRFTCLSACVSSFALPFHNGNGLIGRGLVLVNRISAKSYAAAAGELSSRRHQV